MNQVEIPELKGITTKIRKLGGSAEQQMEETEERISELEGRKQILPNPSDKEEMDWKIKMTGPRGHTGPC